MPFTAEQEARLREIVDEAVRQVIAGTAPVRATFQGADFVYQARRLDRRQRRFTREADRG